MVYKDQQLYTWIKHSSHFKAGDMEKYFSLFKTKMGKSSYEVLLNGAKTFNHEIIVDLAAGSGALAKYLPTKFSQFGKAIAIDFDLEELRKISPTSNVISCCARSQYLPLQSSIADKVYCHLGLMLFSPLNTSLSEISRILKPKGKFIANLLGTSEDKIFNQYSEVAAKYEKLTKDFVQWGDLVSLDLDEIKQLLISAGFSNKLVATRYTVSYQAPLEKLLNASKVFFQIQYLLNEKTRKQYFLELKEKLLQISKSNIITLEIPLIKITAKKE